MNACPYSPYPNLQKVEPFSDVEQLELLIPWDLPLEMKVSNADQNKLIPSLKLILQASTLSSPQEELKLIEKALLILGQVESSPAQITKTQVSLNVWEVKDYNEYFGVNHIETQQPAIALVRSILISYQMFIKLVIQNNNLEFEQIEIQRMGFANYAHLLTRVFNLSLDETDD